MHFYTDLHRFKDCMGRSRIFETCCSL